MIFNLQVFISLSDLNIEDEEKADFDAAVASAKERLIIGDSEQSVLARLQSDGWNVKQSKHILGQARP